MRDTWVVSSVKHLTSAQVVISLFWKSSPTSDSLLSVQSLFWILCPPLSLLLPYSFSPSLRPSLSLKNKQTFKKLPEMKQIKSILKQKSIGTPG